MPRRILSGACKQMKKAPERGLGFQCGGELLSRGLPAEVPSPLAGLTSGFGMGAGCFPAAMAAAKAPSRGLGGRKPENGREAKAE